MIRSVFSSDGRHPARRLSTALALALAALLPPAAGAQVTVVVDGEPRSVVVTADAPTRTAAYAVQELVEHVRLATGGTLDVVPESRTPAEVHTRIYVGETESALRVGIDVERLPRETFVMRSVGNDLYILGRESDADPLELDNPDVGTLFGVYEFLEEFVGVRWLWPGELGTYVPGAKTIVFPSVRRMEQPALLFRHMRIPPHEFGEGSARARLGFSPDVARDYDRALRVLYRRHRLGGKDAHPRGDHKAITWRKYGEKHPEWFVLTRDGKRGNPKPGRPHPFVSLCVTNEELPGPHRRAMGRGEGPRREAGGPAGPVHLRAVPGLGRSPAGTAAVVCQAHVRGRPRSPGLLRSDLRPLRPVLAGDPGEGGEAESRRADLRHVSLRERVHRPRQRCLSRPELLRRVRPVAGPSPALLPDAHGGLRVDEGAVARLEEDGHEDGVQAQLPSRRLRPAPLRDPPVRRLLQVRLRERNGGHRLRHEHRAVGGARAPALHAPAAETAIRSWRSTRSARSTSRPSVPRRRASDATSTTGRAIRWRTP